MEIIEHVLTYTVLAACICFITPTVVAFIRAMIKGKENSKEGDNK